MKSISEIFSIIWKIIKAWKIGRATSVIIGMYSINISNGFGWEKHDKNKIQ